MRHQLALLDLSNEVYGLEQAYLQLEASTPLPLRRCYEAANRKDWSELERLTGPSATRGCALHQLLNAGRDTPRLLALAAERARLDHLGREAIAIADAFEHAGRRRDALALLERSFAEESAPRDRLLLGDRLVTMLYAAHQTARAAQVRALLNAAVQRSRLPFLEYRAAVSSPGSSPQALYFMAGRLAEQHHAYAHCAIALNNQVHDQIDRGQMRAALRAAPHALSCADRSGSDYQRADARVFYGRALSKSGQQHAAEKMLLDAWRYADRSGPRYLRAEVWHNLAHVYEAQARWPDAKRAIERFVATTEPTGESQQIVAYRDAGIIYWNSGDLAHARARFDSMVQLIERYHHEYFWAGEYYERVGDLARARTYYFRALRQEGNGARKTAGLTRVYLALEELDSADVFARMHDAAPLTPEEVLLAPVVEAARGHYDTALKTSTAWAYREESQRNVIGAINAHLQRAELAIAAGRYADAELAARRARALALSSHLKAEGAQALADIGTAQNARTDRAGIALLQDAITEARTAAQENLRSVIWSALAEAYVRADDSRAALAAFDSAAVAARPTAGHFEDSFDRARLRHAMSLRLTRAAWRTVRKAEPALLYEWSVRRKAGAVPRQSLARVQAALPRDGAILDYLVADSGVAVLLITPATTRVVQLATDRATLRGLVQQFRGSIAVAFGSLDRTRSRFAYPTAAQLYDVLVRPLLPFLRTQDRWFISADDALHLVPFDAFVDRQARAPKFVIDDVVTTYLSSVDAIERPRQVALRHVLAMGAAAPGWRDELAAIKSAVPQATELLDPTETRVRSALPTATVLHFAVHAEADARQPRSSYLQLLPGPNDDGQYRFNEITSDHNRADLVVLSACETLYGRVFAGGPLSLASAFVTGGARAVVATQWPVGDKSSEFARALYAQLARGVPPADAVRTARLALRRMAGSDPIFWAPFELYVGSPR